MPKKFKILPLCFLFLALGWAASSCSNDNDEVRMPDTIIGIWMENENEYLEFNSDQTIHKLTIMEQDGEKIGQWDEEVYYYEPGYNLVVYLDSNQQLTVYEIVRLTSDSLTWCWVKDIDIMSATGVEDIGKIIGDVIKEAQEGFTLNPEFYQSFTRISEDEFLSILESIDLMYPW